MKRRRPDRKQKDVCKRHVAVNYESDFNVDGD